MTTSRARVSVGAVVLSFALAMVIGVSGVIAPGGGAALGASTTLTIIGGDVQVSRQGAPFEAAADGAILSPGDVIRTAADARAVLTYFEGSTVSVEPSSELAIDEASVAPDGNTVVVMTQTIGRTWHVVTRLITGGSRYEVRTPAATASVRGTAFEVGVLKQPNGESTVQIVTAEGAVAAAAPATATDPRPEPVVVRAGFRTTARSSDRRPDPPTRAPEPQRTVTVNVANDNSVVVDPLGRSNGFRNGKLVLQTPGAQVVRSDGRLTITLPDLPDGRLSTVLGHAGRGMNAGRADLASDDVEVTTTVTERGKVPATVTERVRPTRQRVTGVELKRSEAARDATPDLRLLTADEKRDLVDSGAVQKIMGRRAAAGGKAPQLEAPADRTPADAEGDADAAPDRGRMLADETSAPERRFVPRISFNGAPKGAGQHAKGRRADEAARATEAR